MASIAERQEIPGEGEGAGPGAMAKPYYADLDVARGVLMALGVVLHAANLFHTDILAGYRVAADAPAFRFLAEAIHLFRMPAFFAVSGFFCAMSLRRHEPTRFLAVRARRILVPLLSVLFSFNLIDLWLRARLGSAPCGGAQAMPCGEMLLHLWFLVVVFVYFLAAAALAAILAQLSDGMRARLYHVVEAAGERPAFLLGSWLAAALVLAYLPHALGSTAPLLVYPPWAFGISVFTLLEYAPFFAFGAALQFLPGPAASWRRFGWGRLALFGGAVTLVPWLSLSDAIDPDLMVGVWAAGAWVSTLTVFALFDAALTRLGEHSRHFAEPAYTVYLAHHVLVLLIGWAMLSAGLSGWPAFALIVSATLAASLLFHHALVRRSRVLGLLFNGR